MASNLHVSEITFIQESLEQEDVWRALQCFPVKNDREWWMIYQLAAECCGYWEESQFARAILSVPKRDMIRRRDGTMQRRQDNSTSTFRAVWLREWPELQRRLRAHFIKFFAVMV